MIHNSKESIALLSHRILSNFKLEQFNCDIGLDKYRDAREFEIYEVFCESLFTNILILDRYIKKFRTEASVHEVYRLAQICLDNVQYDVSTHVAITNSCSTPEVNAFVEVIDIFFLRFVSLSSNNFFSRDNTNDLHGSFEYIGNFLITAVYHMHNVVKEIHSLSKENITQMCLDDADAFIDVDIFKQPPLIESKYMSRRLSIYHKFFELNTEELILVNKSSLETEGSIFNKIQDHEGNEFKVINVTDKFESLS